MEEQNNNNNNSTMINALGIIGIIIGIISFFVYGWVGFIGLFLSAIGYSLNAEKVTPTIGVILNIITGFGWLILVMPYL